MGRRKFSSPPKFSRTASRKRSRNDNILSGTISHTGAMHKNDGIPNQDASFVLSFPCVCSPRKLERHCDQHALKSIYAVGVFDGHGDDGHVASSLASESAQTTLKRLFSSDYRDAQVSDYLKLTFEIMANALNCHPCGKSSGTTATIAIVYKSEVTIGHVGDSCAVVLASHGFRNRFFARYISSMHRPDLETERERIKHAGGIIQGGYVVDKVAKNKGIAVTRTIGDIDMRKNGCISVPQIKTMPLLPSDRAIVLATDGLWDAEGVLLRDVFNALISSQNSPQKFTEALMNTASKSGPSDDCTIAALILS